MRLTLDGTDRMTTLRLAEDDPMPPDDRTTARVDTPFLPLEALYRVQAPRLLRFFTRRTDRQDAGDLVQESFVRLAGVVDDRERTPDQPEAYLNQIAINLLRNRARAAFQRSTAKHICSDEVPLAANDPVATLEARDGLSRVEAAMARLSPKTRDIFMAHRIDGLSYKAISARTGLSVKGVEWHMSKAIAQLARIMAAL